MNLPRRRTRERSGIRDEDGPIRCPGHLAWVRGFVCTLDNEWCDGKTEAAHVRMGLAGGMGIKPGDDRTVPLCSWHHRLQHNEGEKVFWARKGIDPVNVAAQLWQRSPHGIKYRSKRPVRQE